MTDAAWLRSLPTLTGVAPELHTANVPDDPIALFRNWIAVAAEVGVEEPHAMNLATVDADGMPDARTVILKDVDERGWAFAAHRRSAKALQLADHPVAALTFWWQPLVRSVRVRGPVIESSREECEADLDARPPAARAGIHPDDWMLWRVVPERVEFWQGRPDRDHLRLVYRPEVDGWVHDVVPPTPAADAGGMSA